MTRIAYDQPTGQLPGQQTYVKDPSPTTPRDDNHEKERVLPSPPWQRSKPNSGNPQLNKPPGSDDALDGKPLSTERARTLGKPGEESPPNDEPSYGTVKRRPGLSAATKGPQFPGTHRQHEQDGTAKRYDAKYYLKHKNQKRNRAKKWYRKWKNQMALKKDKERRREYPGRFKRLPSNIRDPADRTREWREKQNKKADLGAIPIVLYPSGTEARLLDVDDTYMTADVGGKTQVFPLYVLFNQVVFEDERDIDAVYDKLDRLFTDADTKATKVALDFVADFLYEKRAPNREPGQTFDRANPSHHMWPEHDPSNSLDTGQVTNNPGSSKVIPEGHDFENKNDRALKFAAVRTAMLMAEIREKTSQKVHSDATSLQPNLRKVDPANHVWLFDVPSAKDNKKYRVRVKAFPKGNTIDLSKMDIQLSCSCPFWQWQGPEHWAKANGYLFGRPVGTASKPNVKDPNSQHWACKHVLAVLGQAQKFKLKGKPTNPKTASLRLLADTLDQGGDISPDYAMSMRVAARYLARVGG